ncbi:LOW QUALITY PROTEIN: ankyrin and armadillo repeat-containing protein [Morphnus guianensis]
MYPDSNFASTDAFRYALVLLRSPSDFVRIGCWNLLFKPFISSDANYHRSTSCQVPPGDTKIGLILISVDYMVEVWGMHTQGNVYTVTYRLQQRLALQQKLLKKQLEKIIAICRNIEYLKLMTLVPFLLGFKKKMEIPNLVNIFSHIRVRKL